MHNRFPFSNLTARHFGTQFLRKVQSAMYLYENYGWADLIQKLRQKTKEILDNVYGFFAVFFLQANMYLRTYLRNSHNSPPDVPFANPSV